MTKKKLPAWMKRPPGMIVRTWEKRGETRYAFYYRSSRATGRKLTPLGTDYQLALKAWADAHGAQLESIVSGTVADVYEKHMAWSENRELSGLSPRTIADRKNYWGKKGSGKLQDVFGSVPINSLKPEWMIQYFEARSSQSSAKKELKFLAFMCNWAISRGYMTAPNPTIGIMRGLKVDDKRDIYVFDHWYNLTWECGDQLVRDAMDFTYICGNRPNETERARRSDIQDGVLTIRLAKTEKKGNRIKRLPVEGELKAYVDRQKQKPVTSIYLVSNEKGQPLKVTGTSFKRRWNEARDKAAELAKQRGITYRRFRLMDIRAKAATDVAERDGIEAARKLLGHTTQKQTADYIRSIQGISATAIDKINRQSGESKS